MNSKIEEKRVKNELENRAKKQAFIEGEFSAFLQSLGLLITSAEYLRDVDGEEFVRVNRSNGYKKINITSTSFYGIALEVLYHL